MAAIGDFRDGAFVYLSGVSVSVSEGRQSESQALQLIHGSLYIETTRRVLNTMQLTPKAFDRRSTGEQTGIVSQLGC